MARDTHRESSETGDRGILGVGSEEGEVGESRTILSSRVIDANSRSISKLDRSVGVDLGYGTCRKLDKIARYLHLCCDCLTVDDISRHL